MQDQIKRGDGSGAGVEGNGNLEGFLILSHYIAVFGINNKKAMTFKEKVFSKYEVNAKKAAYDILFWSLLITMFLLPGFFVKDLMSDFSTIKFLFASGLLGLFSVCVTLFLVVGIFSVATEKLNNKTIEDKLENFRKNAFLKKFNIDVNSNLEKQKNEIFLYFSWVKAFADNFSLLNRSSIDFALKRFQYLDESEVGHESKVNKILLDTTTTLLRDIKNNIDSGGTFLSFWQSEKEKQFERVKENNQMILMENIGRIVS